MSRDIGDLNNLDPREKRALLAKLLREKAEQATSPSPLSYGQQALWFLYQSAPESIAYNIAFATRIRSNVNIPVMQQTFQTLLERHPALRTTFSMQDNGEPVQKIHQEQTICFEHTNASTWTLNDLNKRVIEAYQRPFNLERGPVFRVNLFTLAEQDHVLMMTMHHIISDGWSLWILLDELRELYSANISGTRATLPSLQLTYADYVQEQLEVLSGPIGEKLWAYWQQQLSGELSVLSLSTNHPRPPVQTYNGASSHFTLPEELTQQLKKLAQNEGATLYMLLLAAFQVLLFRYTGQEDILIGSPTTGRSQAKLNRIVGYFVNMLVLRADLSANPTFEQFLNQVRHTVLTALEYQDYPFPLLVEKLQPHRNPSHSPIFQVVFNMLLKKSIEAVMVSKATPLKDWGGLKMEPFVIPQEEGQFDLILEMVEAPEILPGTFKYNTDLFDEATIERMMKHFRTLLEGIVANPQHCVAELPLLPDAERHQLLVEWNSTHVDYSMNKCVHELFEAQAEKTPDAVAVIFEEKSMTYGELNSQSNQLARYLQSVGVGPEVLVGIYIERSLNMIVGLLGILKAGGAYVPLDPMHPQERLAFMIEDTKMPVLLTHQQLIQGVPSRGAKIVCLDSDWEIISQKSSENLSNKVTPENLAYVIYTSGSTGKPKGTLIPHEGLLNLVFWHCQAFHVTSSDRATQLAGTAFDASVWEVWPYLTAGARLYLVDSETLSFPEHLRDWLISKKITISFLPTPLTENVLSLEWPENIALRLMLTGGDTLHQHPPLSIPFKLINNYGPTENSVVTTSGEIVSSDTSNNIPPHIGRPISNTQVYILDNHLQLVPIGMPGELHISGTGLARGYLNRPELTQEKFITNPFSNEPGARLYKTGDLVRYLPDGNIEFLGRIDHQVKIRGFRIELGEIESILSQHPAVREVVVMARDDQPGDQRLVAYVVEAETEGQGVKGSELREYLKQKLPDYMLPSAFMMLEAFPLTPNGKINRRALPIPEKTGIEKEYVAPGTPTEKMLTEIWTDVLKLKQIGIHDNFFELGGHSLLATQVISRISETFYMALPLNNLFLEPTIAELAKLIDTIHQAAEDQETSQVAATTDEEEGLI